MYCKKNLRVEYAYGKKLFVNSFVSSKVII